MSRGADSATSALRAVPGAVRGRLATPRSRSTSRGTRRRDAIVHAAAELFAERGFPAVGMDDIGAAAGVTGPAIYRHFDSKAAVLAAVIDTIIDAVAPQGTGSAPGTDPGSELGARIDRYATGVAQRRDWMAVFVREVHQLPADHATRLRARQRELVGDWRALVAALHPSWDSERIRTSVHAVFGMLNAVGTFTSALPTAELAAQLSELARAALRLPADAAGPSSKDSPGR